MASIHQIDLSDVIGELPEIKRFEPSYIKPEDKIALFLCTVGFEERGLEAARSLSQADRKASRCVYFELSTNQADNEINRPKLLKYLETISSRTEILEADTEHFGSSFRKTLQSVIAASGEPRPLVVFDATVTTNRLLMTSMKILLEFELRLVLLYSEASVYHPTLEEYAQRTADPGLPDGPWLDRGVSEVITSQEYPGYHVDQLPDCIIVVPGFNKDRVRAVIQKVDPTLMQNGEKKVLWLLGVPHLCENHWRLDMMRKIHDLEDDDEQFEMETFNYKDALQKLENVYRDRVNRLRFTLSPMGSKMQALACSLFCYLHSDVRVMFATAVEYNSASFSEGCAATWVIEFNSLGSTRRTLDRVGQLQIVDFVAAAPLINGGPPL